MVSNKKAEASKKTSKKISKNLPKVPVSLIQRIILKNDRKVKIVKGEMMGEN